MGNLLTTLGIDQSTQNMLPKDVLEAETFVTAMQVVYESTTEGSKKELLASAIAENVRLLLKEINRLSGGVEKVEASDLPFKVGDRIKAPDLGWERVVNEINLKYESALLDDYWYGFSLLKEKLADGSWFIVKEEEEEKPEEKPSEPKIKEDELPFKVGEKYILRGKGKPYTIEAIDLPKQKVMISGYNNVGNPQQSYFEIKWIAEKIKNGELTLYVEKPKKERKPRATKPKVEKPKKEEPKQEAPKIEPPKVKEISKENKEKIKMLLDEKEEILDALLAFDVTDPEYDELNNEIKRINQEINKLNN